MKQLRKEKMMIEEFLIADGWEKVSTAELAVGDYVARRDDSVGWTEGKVVESLYPKGLLLQEGHGFIEETEVLYRRPHRFPFMCCAIVDGKKCINVSEEIYSPKWACFSHSPKDLGEAFAVVFGGKEMDLKAHVVSTRTDVEVLFEFPEVNDEN